MTDNKNKTMSLQDYIDMFNERYAVVLVGSGVMILDEGGINSEGNREAELVTVDAMKTYHSNVIFYKEIFDKEGSVIGHKQIKVFPAWLEDPNRRTFRGLVFNPKEKPGDCGDGTYNLWAGFKVQPVKGDSSIFWNHMKEVICDNDEEKYIWLRKYFAHMIQKPYEMPKVSPVFKGLEGVGKGSVIEILQDIFGKHYGEYASLDRILGRFNGHLKDKIVIYANEATWGGNKKEHGALKALITDSNRTIEMKSKESFNIKSYVRLIVSSNLDWCVPVGLDDRRFVIFDTNPKYKGNHEYFKKFYEWRKQNGAEHLMYDLLQEDLTNWNPLNRPKSAEKSASSMKIESAEPHIQFVVDWLDNDHLSCCSSSQNSIGNLDLNFGEFHDEYCKWMNMYHGKMKKLPANVFSRQVMGKIIPYRGKKKVNTETIYIIPPVKELREHFERNVLFSSFEWNNEPSAQIRKQGSHSVSNITSLLQV